MEGRQGSNQYSVQFFQNFVEKLQEVCQTYLSYNQFVEVSGYVSVEIDNMKKERYVLSELLQSSGNVVSESYCTKSCSNQGRDQSTHNSHVSPPPMGVRQFERNRVVQKQGFPHGVHKKLGSLSPRRGNNFGRNMKTLENHHGSMNLMRNIRDLQSQKQQGFSQDSCSSTQYSSNTNERNCDNRGRQIVSDSQVGHYNESEVKVHVPARMIDQTFDEVRDSTNDSSDIFMVNSVHELPSAVASSFSLKEVDPSSSDEASTVFDDSVIDLIEDNEQEINVKFEIHSPTVSQNDCTIQNSNPAQLVSPLFTNDIPTQKSSISPGSLHVMKSALKQFQRFHFEKSGQDINLFATSPDKLNQMLCEFYREGRSLNGKELTPGTLKNVQIYLDKYLREGGYLYSIAKDDIFKSSRDFIKAKMSSRSVVAQHHVPVDNQDIEVLFQTNQLGASSAEALINTMWIMNTKLFAIRGPTEHFNLKWGDIVLKVDDEGQEYLEWLGKAMAPFPRKIFVNHQIPERCYVNFYKTYLALRPKLMMTESSAFYLKSNRTSMDNWFFCEGLSFSALSNIWKKMVTQAGLPGNKKIF